MERRKYQRIVEKLKFFYKSDYISQKDWFFGWTNNLSIGGIFAKLPRSLPVGSKLILRVPLEFIRGTTVCNLSATVVRNGNPVVYGNGSIGLSFLQEGIGNERTILTRYIKEKEQTKEVGKVKMLALSGAVKTEKQFHKLMKEAVSEVDQKNKKKGFFAKLFGKT